MIIRCDFSRQWRLLPRRVSLVLISAGSLMLAVVFWSATESALYQFVQTSEFEKEIEKPSVVQQVTFNTPRVGESLPTDKSPRQWSLIVAAGGPDPLLVGKLEIPRLGMSAMVREGVEAATLRKALGHLPGAALPGELGNFIVAGHRDTFFRGLRSIRVSDTIRVRTSSGLFTYHVTALSVVDPSNIEALQLTASQVCTLVTCFPFDYVGPAPRRFIVRAEKD